MGNLVSLTRNGDPGHPCTYLMQTVSDKNIRGPVQFYEVLTYPSPGDADWLFLPDEGIQGVSVTVSFPFGPGSAIIEASDSPPCTFWGSSWDGVQHGTPIGGGPIIYEYGAYMQWGGNNFGGTTDSPLTSITHGIVYGPTAIRLKVTQGSALITVRC